MQAFRGTLIAALALILVAVAYFVLRPEPTEKVVDEAPRLFAFEKHELVRVAVQRPDGTSVVLVEADGEWKIEGTDFVAGRSMVNRVKHQLHDLTARASVVENPDQPELYGLGANALKVTLHMRDGREIAFEAGDPNPSAVSYYIRPVPGSAVFTVKKSAVDYYGLTLDEFRERRFASFDSNDATAIEAVLSLPSAPARLLVERVGERLWEVREPLQIPGSDDQIRRLLGRVAALKAQNFVNLPPGDQSAALAGYGLDKPRADITVRFASRGSLRLLVGGDAPSETKTEELAYMLLLGDDQAAGDQPTTVYVARRGLLEEFSQDPAVLRDRRVVRMLLSDVIAVDATLRARPDEDLSGSHGVRYAAEQWVWKDGVPVPGSTPERVAQTIAEVEVEEFVTENAGSLSEFGLDQPIASVSLTHRDGATRLIHIGAEGPPKADAEGRSIRGRFMRLEGSNAVFLVTDRILRVVEDMIREGNRKAEADAAKAARHERIPSAPDPAVGAQP